MIDEDDACVTRRGLLATAAAGSVPAVAANAGATPSEDADPDATPPAAVTQEVQPEPTGLGVTDLLAVAVAAGVGGLVGGFVAGYFSGGSGDSASPGETEPPSRTSTGGRGAGDRGTDPERPPADAARPRERDGTRRTDDRPPREDPPRGERRPPEDREHGEDVACPACGTLHAPGTNYCRDCGEPL